jgi:hypothetical protein
LDPELKLSISFLRLLDVDFKFAYNVYAESSMAIKLLPWAGSITMLSKAIAAALRISLKIQLAGLFEHSRSRRTFQNCFFGVLSYV